MNYLCIYCIIKKMTRKVRKKAVILSGKIQGSPEPDILKLMHLVIDHANKIMR